MAIATDVEAAIDGGSRENFAAELILTGVLFSVTVIGLPIGVVLIYAGIRTR